VWLWAIPVLAGVTVTVAAGFVRQNEPPQLEYYVLEHASAAEASRMLRELLGEVASQTRIVVDSERNQVVVHGPAESHVVARQLLEEFDRPRPKQKPQVVVRSYACPPDLAENCTQLLKHQFGDEVRATFDASASRIMIATTAQVHERAAALIERIAEQPSSPIGNNVAGAKPNNQDAPAVTGDANDAYRKFQRRQPHSELPKRIQIAVRNRSAVQVRAALKNLLGDRLQPQGSVYLLSTADRRTTRINFNERLNTIELEGPGPIVQQIALLVHDLDGLQPQPGNRTRIIPLRNVDPQALNQAIRAWRSEHRPQQPGQSQYRQFNSPIQLAGFQQPPETEPTAPKLGQVLGTGAAQQDGLRQPASEVDIQALPDLDVIILRGRNPDVEELTRIIREIERASADAASEIEVYYLRHVQGEALSELLSQVLENLTGAMQGRVTATPLGKPNAVLLIGWGESLKAAKELVAKLDRPLDPATQLRVFALKNAPVEQVRTLIEQFFTTRGGLGPRATVTADRRTNALIVTAAPRDMQEVELLVRRLDAGTSQAVNQGRLIRLKNSLAADVAQTLQAAIDAARGEGNAQQARSAVLEMMLIDPNGERVVRSGLLNDVRITPDARTNTLIVSGPADSMELIEELVRKLDESPVSRAQIKVFEIRNGDASELIQVLRSLFPEQADESTVPQLPTAADETSLVPVRFSVDVRTNSIIATGAAGDLKIVEALLLRLDESGSDQRINRVYRLKNSPAIDVAQAVNEFLRSERAVQQAAPGRTNAFQQIESEVVVVPEPVGNSLIISATPRFYDEIMDVVERLDEQPPQVMIQVVLAEVDLDNIHEFGIELGLQDSVLFDRSLLGDLITTVSSMSTQTPNGIVTAEQETIQAASLNPGFDFNNNPLGNSGSDKSLSTAGDVGGQGLSHFALGRVNTELQYGGLVLSASGGNVSVLLRALSQSRHVEILSRPQIMTLDNQPAFIQVGQRVPRITGTSINQIGQVNNVELENVGLILGVRPRISPEGMVVMEIDAEKSAVGPEAEGIVVSVSADGGVVRSPRVDIATAQTTVSAASGQTIVIGGLITNADNTVNRRVPYLSDIPLVGELFKFDSFANRRRELLIILTPHVVRNEADAEYIKQLEMARMSWCSSDVYEMIDPHGGWAPIHGIDDSGVQVIYPDMTPGMDWSQPSTTPTSPDSKPTGDPPVPPMPQGPPSPGNRPNSNYDERAPRESGSAGGAGHTVVPAQFFESRASIPADVSTRSPAQLETPPSAASGPGPTPTPRKSFPWWDTEERSR